ncbi:MAG: hypothetical protein OXH65_03005 [Paracoccaceae bacterium]|nr:hypothetical protein [Paracoccaceae bacterium]
MTPTGRSDNGFDGLLMIGIVAGALVAIWYLWQAPIVLAGLAVSLVAVFPFALLNESLSFVSIPVVDPFLLEPAGAVYQLLTTTEWKGLGSEFPTIMAISGRCLTLMLVPAMVPVLVSGFFSAGSNPRVDRIYRRRHDLDSCIRELSGEWSCAGRAQAINPLVEDETSVPPVQVERMGDIISGWRQAQCNGEQPTTGSWFLPPLLPVYHPPPNGRALRPEEWLEAHGVTRMDGSLEVTVAILLRRQLQTRWTGVDCLAPWKKAIVAALVLIDLDQSGKAERLIDGLMAMMASGRVPFSEALAGQPELAGQVEGLLADHEDRIMTLTANHFWVETAMAELWQGCRAGKGVWPSARFLWLKTVDRPLWYTISSLGGNVSFVESAGILAHHRAEVQMKMPLAVPLVGTATEAMVNEYLDMSQVRVEGRRQRQRTQARTVPGDILAPDWEETEPLVEENE